MYDVRPQPPALKWRYSIPGNEHSYTNNEKHLHVFPSIQTVTLGVTAPDSSYVCPPCMTYVPSLPRWSDDTRYPVTNIATQTMRSISMYIPVNTDCYAWRYSTWQQLRLSAVYDVRPQPPALKWRYSIPGNEHGYTNNEKHLHVSPSIQTVTFGVTASHSSNVCPPCMTSPSLPRWSDDTRYPVTNMATQTMRSISMYPRQYRLLRLALQHHTAVTFVRRVWRPPASRVEVTILDTR